jgi:hypothetical protein
VIFIGSPLGVFRFASMARRLCAGNNDDLDLRSKKKPS